MAVAKGTICAFGVQFEKVGGVQEIPVNEIFTIDVPKPGSGYNGLTDCMQIWSMADKKFYNYFLKTNVGWVKVGQADMTKPTADTVKAGDGVYFKRPSSANANLTISGQINTVDEYVQIDVTKGTIKCMTYPYPIDLPIDDLRKYIDVRKSGSGYNGLTDTLQMWDSANKKYVNYYDKTNVGWVKVGQTDMTKPTEDKILAGHSIMFKRPSSANATFKFTKPEGL